MDADLENVYNLVNEAVRAEDVFGALLDPQNKKGPKDVLEDKFMKLSEVADPGRFTEYDDREIAQDVIVKLHKFYEKAVVRLAENIYGETEGRSRLVRPGRSIFKTGKREYFLGEAIAEGSISTVYDGECAMGDEFAGRVAIKIVDDSSDNELILREMRTLNTLHEAAGNQRRHLPVLLDHFMTSDGKMGLVFRYLLGEGYDLHSIREDPLYKKGVDRKHMVWMLNRLLSAVGYAHSLGIVHCNIEPSNLIVRPRDHNLFVIDWCWSATKPWQTGDKFQIYTDHYSAPEVKDNELPPAPAADLYSIGKCMIYILGGNVKNNEMPDSVEPELDRFLKSMVIKSQSQRAQDAWQTHGELIDLCKKLWGERKFLNFPMSQNS